MGKYDLVEEVLLSLGAEFFFTGALIQPGKPVVFGRLGRSPDLLLWTAWQSCIYHGYVLALCRAAAGRALRRCRSRTPFRAGSPGSDVHVKTGLTRFCPPALADMTVEPVSWQGSGDLASTSRSNCFLVVPADRPLLAAGETVTILLA